MADEIIDFRIVVFRFTTSLPPFLLNSLSTHRNHIHREASGDTHAF